MPTSTPVPTNPPSPFPTYTFSRLTATPTPQYSIVESGDVYDCDYSWKYKGTEWTYTTKIPKESYNYYKNRDHSGRDYVKYVLSDYDRTFLQDIVKKFQEAGHDKGYTKDDNVRNVVAFVQSLPYTSDDTSTGYDEYPRYPIETLVDGGGDCEDSSILVAALLHEMGYGVVLLQLPQHMAVGVKGSDSVSGSYYTYNGDKYLYLETTESDWDIGEIPSTYKSSKATIRPLIQKPEMKLTFKATVSDSDLRYVYYTVHCDLENIGSGTAKDLQLYIVAEAPTEGSNLVWDQKTMNLDDYDEDVSGWAEYTLKIPRGTTTRITCSVGGSNVQVTSVSSSLINT